MSPNLENQMPDSPDIEASNDHIHLTLTPISDLSASTSFSDGNQSIESVSNEEVPQDDLVTDVVVTSVSRNYVALEHNIRELLVRISNTEELETVTQIKLRVIARELALQHLGIYLPGLRELNLDGSIVSSLRDLGYGLRNLRILRVNRCQLTCIDGVLGFEYLEELHAADNGIKDLSPCAFLSNLRVIDVRRNSIRHFGSLNFLNLCPDLVHVLLEGNEATGAPSGYRNFVGRVLPHLRILDGEPLLRVESSENPDISIQDLEGEDEDSDETQNVFGTARLPPLARSNPRNHEETGGFTISFPPKVCGNNGKST